MNIAVFSKVNYWQGVKGGMDIHGKLLSEGLVQRGHRVQMICTRHPDGIDRQLINGVEYHYLEDTSFGSYMRGWKRGCIRKLEELNRMSRFDIIWSQSFAGYPYGNSCRYHMGIPMVSIIHGTVVQGLNSWWTDAKSKMSPIRTLKGLFGAIYNYFFIQYPALKISDHIICVSEQIEREVKRFYFTNEDKTSVVYNGIDCSRFSPDKDKRIRIRKQYNINDGEIVLLTMGTINREKGHHLAIKTLRILVDKGLPVRLMIAGDGPLMDALKKQALNLVLDKRVIFCGYIPNEETPDYYNASDIFIFPTLRLESFGIVLAEAMACEKPIIASDIGSIPYVIDNGINGLLIPPGDYKELAKQIEFLSGNKKFAEMLSKNAGLKSHEKFNLDKMIEDTIERFEGVSSQKYYSKIHSLRLLGH